MKYITNIAGMSPLYAYGRGSYRHSYVAAEQRGYRDELPHQYKRPSSAARVAEYQYFLLSPRRKNHWLDNEKREQDFLGWAGLLYQVSLSYSNNHKEVKVKKPQKMGIRLMELKTDGSHYEFLIRESVMDEIVTWECLPDADTVRQYLKKHRFPKDRLYSEKVFLEDVAKATGYIHLFVERRRTAEFISDLCSALI
jgi:hypothetical protein